MINSRIILLLVLSISLLVTVGSAQTAPSEIPNCPSRSTNTEDPCDLQKAAADVQQKLLEVQNSVGSENSTTYFDCAACVHSIEFDNGGVYWTREHSAHVMYGLIWRNWKSLTEKLRNEEFGYPISDMVEDVSPNWGLHWGWQAFYNQFRHGRIYAYMRPRAPWMNSSRRIYGSLYDKFLAIRASGIDIIPYENITCYDANEPPYQEACECWFEGGNITQSLSLTSIHWNSDTGAHFLRSPILSGYYNWEKTGYAISDETPTNDGQESYMLFKNGNQTSAVFTANTIGYWVNGSIWEYFQSTGGVGGHLVRPLTPSRDAYHPSVASFSSFSVAGEAQDFVGGGVYHSYVTNQVFEARNQSLVSPKSIPRWKYDWQPDGMPYSGNLTLWINPCNFANVRLLTDFSGHSNDSFDFTVACALKDPDGRVYSLFRTGTLDGTDAANGGRLVVDEKYSCYSGHSNINQHAIVFAGPLECMVKVNEAPWNVVGEVVGRVTESGEYLEPVINLLERPASEASFEEIFWCDFPKEDLWS